jgi:hypothetical protein
MSATPDWKNFFRMPMFDGASVDGVTFAMDWGAIVEHGDGVISGGINGVPLIPFDQLLKQLTDLGGVVTHEVTPSKTSLFPSVFLIWSNTAVSIDVFSAATHLRIVGNNRSQFDTIFKVLSDAIAEPDRSGKCYILTSSDHGIVITDLGMANVPLVRDNYPQEVLEGYDHIVSDLNADNPCGRVVLLDGVAGSGKTHLLYGMMATVENAMFLYVPAGLVASMVSPEFMTVLIRERDNASSDGPIILVIEDADSCLVSRQADNMNSISALLNIGEGVLGRLLDIRIIATTNAKDSDIDSALIRPGRLCKRVGVGKLTVEHANAILTRLLGKTAVTKEKENSVPEMGFSGVTGTWAKSGPSLAEVYKQARDLGWVPPTAIRSKKKKRRNRGFSFGDE